MNTMKSLCVKSDGEVHSTRLEEYAEGEDGMCSRSESRIKGCEMRGIQTRSLNFTLVTICATARRPVI
jgi:hypothetical protein